MKTLDKIKIKKARKNDLKEIAEIIRIEYGKYPYNESWTKSNALKRVQHYYQHNLIFISEINKKIIGFVVINTIPSYIGLRGFIEDLVVKKEFQGEGIGGRLFNFAENYLKKKGAGGISLMVFKKSNAFKIYKKKGYKEIGWVFLIKKLK